MADNAIPSDWLIAFDYPAPADPSQHADTPATKYFTLSQLLAPATEATIEAVRCKDKKEKAVRSSVPRALYERGVVLGRGKYPDEHDKLVSPVVSKVHCSLLLDTSGGIYITDLHSAHGTSVRNTGTSRPVLALQPRVPTRLFDGDTVTFGKAVSGMGFSHGPLSVTIRYRYGNIGQTVGSRHTLQMGYPEWDGTSFASDVSMVDLERANVRVNASPASTGRFGIPASVLYTSDNDEPLPRSPAGSPPLDSFASYAVPGVWYRQEEEIVTSGDHEGAGDNAEGLADHDRDEQCTVPVYGGAEGDPARFAKCPVCDESLLDHSKDEALDNDSVISSERHEQDYAEELAEDGYDSEDKEEDGLQESEEEDGDEEADEMEEDDEEADEIEEDEKEEDDLEDGEAEVVPDIVAESVGQVVAIAIREDIQDPGHTVEPEHSQLQAEGIPVQDLADDIYVDDDDKTSVFSTTALPIVDLVDNLNEQSAQDQGSPTGVIKDRYRLDEENAHAQEKQTEVSPSPGLLTSKITVQRLVSLLPDQPPFVAKAAIKDEAEVSRIHQASQTEQAAQSSDSSSQISAASLGRADLFQPPEQASAFASVDTERECKPVVEEVMRHTAALTADVRAQVSPDDVQAADDAKIAEPDLRERMPESEMDAEETSQYLARSGRSGLTLIESNKTWRSKGEKNRDGWAEEQQAQAALNRVGMSIGRDVFGMPSGGHELIPDCGSSTSGSDVSSAGPITPPSATSNPHLKRTLSTADFDEPTASYPRLKPYKRSKSRIPDERAQRQRIDRGVSRAERIQKIGLAAGLVALGAVAGSMGTMIGLMNLAD